MTITLSEERLKRIMEVKASHKDGKAIVLNLLEYQALMKLYNSDKQFVTLETIDEINQYDEDRN